ncbi:unnamed protein product [Cylicocyclus nassatus]|uniref:Secreted protein n=1 Tax=Cylicocyclus nassatus TaxID=53992 RepID=A0AA36LZL8_CYLNA|nr:unnamed protein product [Cylicocyclus nassatus]
MYGIAHGLFWALDFFFLLNDVDDTTPSNGVWAGYLVRVIVIGKRDLTSRTKPVSVHLSIVLSTEVSSEHTARASSMIGAFDMASRGRRIAMFSL